MQLTLHNKKKRNSIYTTCCLVLFMNIFPNSHLCKASRKTTSPSKTKQEHGTVDVRASREKEEAKDLSSSVTILKPNDSRVQDLAETIEKSVGVRIKSLGGLGAGSSVSIRGSNPNQVQILFDGVPLNMGGTGVVNLGDLPADALKHIEIYRGFVPIHLGGAMGGAIQLITHYPKGVQASKMTLSLGSFRTGKVNLSHIAQIGKWNLFLFGQYLGTGGDFSYFDDRGTPLQLKDDRMLVSRQNNHSHSGTTLLKSVFQPHRNIKLKISDLITLRDQGVPGLGLNRTKEANFQSIRHLIQIESDALQFPVSGMRWKNQLHLHHQLNRFQDTLGEIGIGQHNTNDLSWSLGTNSLLYWWPSNEHEISVSTSLRTEHFLPEDSMTIEQGSLQHRRWMIVPALQYQAVLFDEKLSFLAGARFEGWFQSSQKTQTDSNTTNTTRWLPVGRIGLRYQPLDFFWTKVNAGGYARNPSFWELFGNNGALTGNPDLLPEMGWMWDIGTSLVLPFHKAAPYSLQTDIVFFWRNSENIIRFVQNSQSTVVSVNIAQAQTYGIEGRLRMHIWNTFFLQGDLTWMKARNASNINYEKGNILPGRPEIELALQAETKLSWSRFFYIYTFASHNFLDRANTRLLASRHLHRIGWQIQPTLLAKQFKISSPWDGLFINIEIKNLFDSRVERAPLVPPLPNIKTIPQAISDFIGYPLPGRSFYITVNWKV